MRRPAVLFVLGLVVGVLLGLVTPHLFPHRPQLRRLTEAVDLESAFFFRDPSTPAPMIGQLQAGTEVEVEMRKGPAAYVAFRTVVAEEKLTAVTVPLDKAR